jgi:hypothetical protein
VYCLRVRVPSVTPFFFNKQAFFKSGGKKWHSIFLKVDAAALIYQLQTVKRVDLVNIWTRLKKSSPQLSLAGETVDVPPPSL